MVDNLVLLLTHSLLMICAYRLWRSDALDDDSHDTGYADVASDDPPPQRTGFGRQSAKKGWNRPRA